MPGNAVTETDKKEKDIILVFSVYMLSLMHKLSAGS